MTSQFLSDKKKIIVPCTASTNDFIKQKRNNCQYHVYFISDNPPDSLNIFTNITSTWPFYNKN